MSALMPLIYLSPMFYEKLGIGYERQIIKRKRPVEDLVAGKFDVVVSVRWDAFGKCHMPEVQRIMHSHFADANPIVLAIVASKMP